MITRGIGRCGAKSAAAWLALAADIAASAEEAYNVSLEAPGAPCHRSRRDKATGMTDFDSESYLAQLTTRPGVYQMFDDSGELLYVGKAKNLKNQGDQLLPRIGPLCEDHGVGGAHCRYRSDGDHHRARRTAARHTLIKQYRPPYNILLKDDKSYPYIYLSSEDQWPRLSFHRGTKRRVSEYLVRTQRGRGAFNAPF